MRRRPDESPPVTTPVAPVILEPPESEQQTDPQADIVRPGGRLFFAGEHCSMHHAWIQGDLASGIRAAREIHGVPAD